MFLPIGDEPNLRGTPVVTYALIAINVAVFLLVSVPLMGQPADPSNPLLGDYLPLLWERMGRGGASDPSQLQALARRVSAYDLLKFAWGFKPGAPSVIYLFPSIFLHGGWLHVGGNMLFLWIYGDNVELRVGRPAFVLIYLGTGIAASLFHMVFQLDSLTPMIGASGAISGILGCYFLWFPDNRVKMLVVLFFFVDVIMIPARWVLGFYLVVENLLPFLVTSSEAGGVAHGAHIGGFLGGLAVAFLARRSGWVPSGAPRGRTAPRMAGGTRSGWPRPATDAPLAPRMAFTEALRAGDFDAALRAYSEMSRTEQTLLDDTEVFALADWLADHKRHELALSILQRFIAAAPDDRALARAHLRAGLVQLYGLQQLPAAREHLLQVLDLNAPVDVRHVAKDALNRIEGTPTSWH